MSTPKTPPDKGHDELETITDRLRDESQSVRAAFAQLNTARNEAWERHATEVQDALEQMQADLDDARARLAVEQARTRAEARDDLNEVLAALHGRYDELRLQIRLGEMNVSDGIGSVRHEAGQILDRGRSAVRNARDALGQLVPES